MTPRDLFALLAGIIIGASIVTGIVIIATNTPAIPELPIPVLIKTAMVQDKNQYCRWYEEYLEPDWDTTYNLPDIPFGADSEVAQTICTCGQPYKIGGYKWKVDCIPT